MAVRARPWGRPSEPTQPEVEERGGRLHVAWPESLAGGWYSIEVWVPQQAIGGFSSRIEISGFRRPLAWLRPMGQGHLFTSPRFAHDIHHGPPPIEMEIPPVGSGGIAFALYRWHPPRPAKPAGSGSGGV